MPDGFGLASLGDGAEVIVRADTCLGDRDDDEAGHDLADVHTRYSEAGPWGGAGLDEMMWRWVEDDKDAQRTAAFTSFGLLGGKFARRVLFLCAVVTFVVSVYLNTSQAQRSQGAANVYESQNLAAFWFVAVTAVTLALMWTQRPRQANALFLYRRLLSHSGVDVVGRKLHHFLHARGTLPARYEHNPRRQAAPLPTVRDRGRLEQHRDAD